MQSLLEKKKRVISFGVITSIVGIGAMMAIVPFIPIQTNEGNNLSPSIGMPVPGNTVPDMVVSDDLSISTGMPVPGENTPEMLVLQNSNGFQSISN